MDDLKHAIYHRLIRGTDARDIPAAPGFDIIFVAHNLERIADHAANISEDVLFMITGSGVRHSQ